MEGHHQNKISITAFSFRLLYDAVSDAVFVLRPTALQIVEGNTGFRNILKFAAIGSLSCPLQQVFASAIRLDVPPGEVQQAFIQLPDEELLPVDLYIREAILEEEAVLIGIAREQKSPAAYRQALAAAGEEKNALLKEVYHRVKNNLNIIVSLMSLQLNRVDDPSLRMLLTESKGRVHTLALLQERLYHSPRLSEVKTNEYLLSLMQAVIATYKDRKQQFKLHTDMQECWLNVDVLVPVGLIVHEFLANAVLHAYKGQESGEVYLGFTFSEGVYKLVVADKGIGLPENKAFTSFTSLGVQLVVSLARQLKGQLHVVSEPDKGTSASLVFSLPNKNA